MYCSKWKLKTDSINQNFAKTNKGKLMILSNCAVCNTKKLKFIKEQEPSGLLSCLGIKTPLNKIPLVGPFFF